MKNKKSKILFLFLFYYLIFYIITTIVIVKVNCIASIKINKDIDILNLLHQNDEINLDKKNNNNNNNKKLRFNKNFKYKIIQFTDLHYGEGENETWGIEQDINSTRVMNNILDIEIDVDLILFTGDLITGNNIFNGNASIYWEKAISVAKNRNIPWAITFGNHDDLSTTTSGNINNQSRYDLMLFDIKLGSLSKLGDPKIPGVSNYNLKIYNYMEEDNDDDDNDEEEPISLIWLFDSGDSENDCNNSNNNNNNGNYTCNTFITYEQIKWYEEESKKFKNTLWEGAFFHIPLQEYMIAWNFKNCYGWNNDSIACQPINDGLFSKFIELSKIKLISVGHNHGNDFCSNLDNIELCFGRHTGYGGYGTWERGARVIQLSFDPIKNKINHNTYITFETGQQLFNQPIHYSNSTQRPQTICTT